MNGIVRDLRYGVRRLLRAPGFCLGVILCMGLGLGATAGVFSFIFGIVLRPLPFPQPDRLVVLFETSPGFTRASPTYTDYEGWRENASAFSGLGPRVVLHRVCRTASEGSPLAPFNGPRVAMRLPRWPRQHRQVDGFNDVDQQRDG